LSEVVTHAPQLSRYELRLDGELVGVADYVRRNDRIVFTHTEVDPERRGKGWAQLLVERALRDAERENLEVVPACPFVSWYIEHHPEYATLVVES
jgi:uncharacterized protein